MNKSMLSAVILSALASGSAMAATTTNAYFGAELGGKIATGDQAYDVNYDNMLKVGGDVKMKYNEAVTFTAGGEARYTYEGLDNGVKGSADEVKARTHVERMTVGMDTAFGSTTFGAQNNVADDLKGFGDLSAEYGFDGGFDNSKSGTETLMHTFATDKFSVAASYDIDKKDAVLGGTFNLGVAKVGAVYAHGGEKNAETDTFRLGTEAQFGKIGVGAAYTFMDADGQKDSNNAYAVSANYALTDAVKLSTSYNIVEDNNVVDGDDQYATIGAAYQLNQHVELVTDYKAGSNHDDQLFLRANINF